MRTFFVALLLALCGTVRAETVYFIHVDHLNTPRLAVSEDGPVRWRWEQIEPFGENVALQVLGTEGYLINLPLRFPGQYLDKETNLHYNYFRDYDPGMGRYMQSDPIGLLGGLNTYAYSLGRPLEFVDPTGEAAAAVCIAVVVTVVAIYGAKNLISTLDRYAKSAAAQGSSAVECVATADQSVCTKAQAQQIQTYQDAGSAASASTGLGRGFPSSRPTHPTSAGRPPVQPREPIFPPRSR